MNMFATSTVADFLDLAELWDRLGKLSVVGRPPAYQLLTLPMVVLFGPSEASALSINVVFLVALIVAVYKLGSIVKDGDAGLIAVFLTASSPPVIHISRMYLPHLAVSALAATTLWLLLALVQNRSKKIAWCVGASLATGLMLHPYYAWILAAPTLTLGIYLVFFHAAPKRPQSLVQTPDWLASKLRDRFVLFGLLPAASIAVVPFLLWYLTWGLDSLDQMSLMRSWPRVYTIGFPKSPPTFWWYAGTAPGALSAFVCLLVIGALVYAIARPRAPSLVLLLTTLAAYTTYSLMPTRWWVHFATVVPVLSVLIAAWISSLRPSWIRKAALIASLGSCIFTFYFTTWGNHSWSRQLAISLGSPLADTKTCSTRSTAAFCPAPAEPARWPWAEILLKVSDDCKRRRPCTLMTVEKPIVSLCSYYLAKHKIGNVLITFSRIRQRQYNLKALLGSDYLLLTETGLALWDLPEDRASRQFLESPPVLFSKSHRDLSDFDLPLSPSRSARLIKRVRGLRAAEAEEAIDALDLPDEWKKQTFEILAGLYSKEGDFKRARLNYEKIESPAAREALHGLFKD